MERRILNRYWTWFNDFWGLLGEFTNLKVDSLVVNTAQVADTNYNLTTALRALGYIDQNNWAVVSNTGVLQSCLAGTITNSSNQSKDNLGIICTAKFGKTDGDVNVKIYVYYDGTNDNVFTEKIRHFIFPHGCGEGTEKHALFL